MAGNQSLGLAMADRSVSPDHIIDLNNIEELAFINESYSMIEIGAMTRHRELEQSTLLEKKLPALSEAAYIAGPSVRNRGRPTQRATTRRHCRLSVPHSPFGPLNRHESYRCQSTLPRVILQFFVRTNS